ncbi:MAG: ABC transporter permease [Clostridium sp.]
MRNLIKLEMKKFKLQGYIKYALITHLILLFFLIALEIILKIEKKSVADILEISRIIIGAMGSVTFSIFASMMLANIVIGEYSNKTINLMFMYPISRKKIFLSKLIIVVIFTFINIVISNLLLSLALVIVNSVFNLFPWDVPINSIIISIPKILLNAILTSGTALIPLYFGMKKKSISTLIVASLIVSTIMYSGTGSISIYSTLPLTIIVAFVGFLLCKGMLNKLDTEDVL